jgi:hypothetical protein
LDLQVGTGVAISGDRVSVLPALVILFMACCVVPKELLRSTLVLQQFYSAIFHSLLFYHTFKIGFLVCFGLPQRSLDLSIQSGKPRNDDSLWVLFFFILPESRHCEAVI